MRIELYIMLILTTLKMSCSTCSQQQINSFEDITLLEAPYCEEYNADKRRVITFLSKYINDMFYLSQEDRNKFWHSDILNVRKDWFLRSSWTKEEFLKSQPKLLGVRTEHDSIYHITLQFDYLEFPLKIMNLKIISKNNHYKFIDLLGENIKSLRVNKRGNYKFYYSDKLLIQEDLEMKTIKFSNYLSDFFSSDTIHFTTIATNSITDYYKLMGYDYVNRQTLDNQNGGLAETYDNIVFSGNGTPYYPHEIVHLYTSHFKCHRWFDEGLATYLGGSAGKSLDYHICKLQGYLEKLDFDDLLTMTSFDFETDYQYVIGGLIVKLIIEEYGGKSQLFSLMDNGRSDKDFYKSILTVFDIEKNELDHFLKLKIKNYECL